VKVVEDSVVAIATATAAHPAPAIEIAIGPHPDRPQAPRQKELLP